jgi:putative ABC transport system permease protein
VQEALVATQVAMATVLVLAAGLMAPSVVRLTRLDVGFEPRDGAAFALQIPFRGYETYQRTAAFDLAVLDALRRVAGVTDAAAVMELPSTPQLLNLRPTMQAVHADGRVTQAAVQLNVASADFFRVMRIPLRAGRAFTRGDLSAATPGVVLGATLARELFGDGDPIGREVKFVKGRHPAYRVVGVAGDVFSHRVTQGALRSVYFPLLEDLPPTSAETEERIPVMPSGMHFVVRSALPVAALAPALRRAVSTVDRHVPVWAMSTLDDVVAATTSRVRLTILLLGISGAAALLLGVIGISSVIAYAIAGRAPEFAVRLALGDSPHGITWLAIRQGIAMVVAGILAGVIVSLASGRVLRGLLYEVSARDPQIYLLGAVVIGSVAILAMYMPARRAGGIDPATTLRT